MSSGLLYFLPGVSQAQLVGPLGRLSRALLAERGLAVALADVESLDDVAVSDLSTLGPGGQSGVILYPLPPGRALVRSFPYSPEVQRWEAAFDEPARYWIGVDPVEPPSPAGLARAGAIYPGHDLELADGQEWTVPVVRRPGARPGHGVTELPCEIRFAADGSHSAQIAARYRALWDAMEPYVGAIFAGAENHFDPHASVRLAVEILAINYRLGLAEMNVLRALTTTNWCQVVRAAMDVPFYEEIAAAQKKSGSSGEAAAWSTAPG